MRLLFSTTAGQGHFAPLLPIARAAADAGHEILIAAPESFATAVEQSGHRHWPCGDIDRSLLTPVERDGAQQEAAERLRAGQVFAELGPQAMLPGLLAAIDSWRPDLVVRECAELGSLIAAEMRGIPHIQVLFGLGEILDRVHAASPLVGAWSERFGIDADAVHTAIERTPSVTRLPAGYDVAPSVAHGPIHRFRDLAGRADTAVGRDAHRDPLVFVSFGTEVGKFQFGESALRRTVQALADLPVRLLVATGGVDTAGWGEFGDRVRIERWVEQDVALQQAALVVCHAGSGTTLAALERGIPLVAVPLFADQPANAARIEASGVGLKLDCPPDGAVDPVLLQDTVMQVLNGPGYREASESVAREIALLPPVEDVLALLKEAGGADRNGRPGPEVDQDGRMSREARLARPGS